MSDSNADSIQQTLEALEQRLRTGIERSRLASTVRTLGRYVRHSWLYRWLTPEPDPEVIVIDLRETYTVGPFIRLLDRMLGHCARATPSSRTVEFSHRVEDRFRARPLRVLGAAILGGVVFSGLVSIVLGQIGTGWVIGHAVLAGLAVLGLRSERSLEDLTETRAWELLVAAFEPPEPPTESEIATEEDGSVDDSGTPAQDGLPSEKTQGRSSDSSQSSREDV
ncbi:hypothetical protein [Halopiger xanaduensis]|uniref:Uncharacterized protein n=1 Tax=Halopiger xanaduensis (strain DSM 18323 / JCM 14033 / SH-6) TaxID=797210 RepID=F8DA36_HALXS|nr:hypothetical protein [Halopiger xanaduensis]AEH36957.1 hypothetical protein Halxa_2335 [Halopiger xanaduensis SH-6]